MRSILQILRMWSMLTLAGMLLLACDPKVTEYGRGDLLVKAGNLMPQQSTESDVQRLLGTPAATAQFGEKVWYYFGSRNETTAFLAPKTTQQGALRIAFDNGVVSTVEFYNEEQARDIAFSERETPTAGKRYGFVEQLIGNVGRFNKQQDSMATSPRRGGGAIPGG